MAQDALVLTDLMAMTLDDAKSENTSGKLIDLLLNLMTSQNLLTLSRAAFRVNNSFECQTW